jgi:hypothetical protein
MLGGVSVADAMATSNDEGSSALSLAAAWMR